MGSWWGDYGLQNVEPEKCGMGAGILQNAREKGIFCTCTSVLRCVAMPVSLPSELRQRYGKLADSELSRLVRQLLESPCSHDDQMLKEWLVALSFAEVRPLQKTNVSTTEWRRWIAFALRYLEPLAVNGAEPNTRARVLEEMNQADDRLIGQLLFGSAADGRDTLRSFFRRNQKANLTSIALPNWQQQVIDAVRCPDYGEEVIKNWSRTPIEVLLKAVTNQLRPTLNLVAHESVQALCGNVERPSAMRSETFHAFLEMTSRGENRAYYGQALGYQNEFARRQDLTLTYGRAAKWASLFVSPLAVGIAFAWKGELLGWIVSLGLLAFVVVVFYGRLFNNVLDTFTWARAAQNTMVALVGEPEQNATLDANKKDLL